MTQAPSVWKTGQLSKTKKKRAKEKSGQRLAKPVIGKKKPKKRICIGFRG